MMAEPNIASNAPSDRLASKMLDLVFMDQIKIMKQSVAENIKVGKMHFSIEFGVFVIGIYRLICVLRDIVCLFWIMIEAPRDESKI